MKNLLRDLADLAALGLMMFCLLYGMPLIKYLIQ
jgi:hypothetical protein